MKSFNHVPVWRALMPATALLLILTSCSASPPRGDGAIGEVEPGKYELVFVRCEVETDEEYAQSQSDPSIGGDDSRRVIAEYRITNLDDIRRRFDIRATRTDSAGQTFAFIPQDTARLDPGESVTETINRRVVASDVRPYTCDAEVWDSIVDLAFPDD